MRNHLSLFEACYCIVSQFFGAMLAGAVCYALYDSEWSNIGFPSVSNTSDKNSRPRAFVGEMLQAFALTTTVLNVATTKAQKNNSYFGLAIGFVLLAGALVMGEISGACFNPAIGNINMCNI
jgi:aquaporin Z